MMKTTIMRISFLPLLLLVLLVGAVSCGPKDNPDNPGTGMIDTWVLTHEPNEQHREEWIVTTKDIQFTIHTDSSYKANTEYSFLGMHNKGTIKLERDSVWMIQPNKPSWVPVRLQFAENSKDTLYAYGKCLSSNSPCYIRWKFARAK